MVEKSKSGHPGAPMGLAPLAHLLFTQHMKMSPKSSSWISRDRFVLSNGHACALQYIMLHLLGYKVSMDDLKSFRQLDSNTPGHPEASITDGIEVSTGPLGQGISNAVGMAIAQANISATFSRQGFESLFDNYIFCIVGDGCMQEGISNEALSLAGHLKLHKLIVLYDDNRIQIDGDTCMAFTEDVSKRMEAYGFQVYSIDDGDNDLDGISNAITKAKASKHGDKPSFIRVKTTIGIGSLNQGTEKVHGAPLGTDQVKQLKKFFEFDENDCFVIPDQVQKFYDDVHVRLEQEFKEWEKLFKEYSKIHPELSLEIQRRASKQLPSGWKDALPRYTQSDPPLASRKMSEAVLNNLAPICSELIGGSADLTHSNLTRWKGALDFQPTLKPVKCGECEGCYYGNYIRFGVREHAMFGICNGISSYGMFIPFAATFLNFITYGFGSVRLSALSHHQVIYIMTHDSIGLGEDGPTHQPIETLAALRALPNILVIRPGDGNEVSGAYSIALSNTKRPSVICLSRQNIPNLNGTDLESVALGAYSLNIDDESINDIILVATGSELSLAVQSSHELKEKHSLNTRVVSMPCWELFEEQSYSYQESVFPPNIPILSIEALSTFGWDRYAHAHIGMKTFGASAPYKELYVKFGFTVQNVVEKALLTIEYYRKHQIPHLIAKPF